MSDDQVPSGREACHDLNPDWQPGDPITYINPEAPAATVPPYDGERYQALVPDTFDVAERARQVINPLTEATDADADREIYFMGVFCVKPALLCHGVSDANVQPKFQLTVPLMRMISGSDQNLHVEAEWITRLRRCIGPDGLFYLPLRGRPWEAVSIPHWIRTGPGRDQYLNPFAMGMTLAAMTLLARRETGEEWSAKARAMVDGLIELAVEEGEIAYFWPSAFRAVKDRPAATEPPTTEENGEACRLPYGLVHAYRLLGHEPALTLAGKNLRYLRRCFFREDGSFLREPFESCTPAWTPHVIFPGRSHSYNAGTGGTAPPEWSGSWSVGAQASPHGNRCKDRNGTLPRDGQQVVVSGHHGGGVACQGELQKRQVCRIPARGHVRRLRHDDGFAPRKVLGQQIFSLILRQAELGIAQHPDELAGRSVACQRHDIARLPRVAQPRQRSRGKQQCGQQNVGVENQPRPAYGARLAHSTASRTSASDMPSAANLARTALARVSRTGVSTMRPFSLVTSKYSQAGNSPRRAFGRVS